MRTLGPDDPGIADDYHTLAKLNHAEGNYPEADRLYLMSIEMSERHYGVDHPWVERARRDRAAMLAETGGS